MSACQARSRCFICEDAPPAFDRRLIFGIFPIILAGENALLDTYQGPLLRGHSGPEAVPETFCDVVAKGDHDYCPRVGMLRNLLRNGGSQQSRVDIVVKRIGRQDQLELGVSEH